MGNGAFSIAFVRPSVSYIENNSRTRRPSVPKFGRKVFHLWCDSHTSFKVKRSQVKVTRPINADTHLPNGKAYELQSWYADDDPHQPQAPWPPRFKVKVARSRDKSEPSWHNALPVSLESGGLPCRPNPVATFLVVHACCIVQSITSAIFSGH